MQLRGLQRHSKAQLDAIVADLFDAFHLEVLYDERLKLGVIAQSFAYGFGNCFDLGDVGFVGDRQQEFDH
ncbi:hypothetical protein D3C80_1790020 [compost metagenome]